MPQTPNAHDDDFARQAEQASPGLLRELLAFLAHNKKWWLLPIILFVLLLSILVLLGNPAVAPFIYTLF
jgi:hypothetical protein